MCRVQSVAVQYQPASFWQRVQKPLELGRVQVPAAQMDITDDNGGFLVH